MKLKKLTINGFKSFADKITIHFDCDIIAIVGPNGCGKSNIVDAFRWVMGEQSAKSLRGDRMHDVLFAGTEGRKALNYAEVSVLLSEVNGELPLPYDEVLMTRRLYRSGESEYYLNKEMVRLKDMQNLLLGSGLGKNAFSIFEQGKLDQIIHLNPLERRVIFDEAAGTSRFLQRKKESLRKLESVNENLLRVSDIHSEIERQAKQLKKQAICAKTYQENKSRLERLEKYLLCERLQQLQQEGQKLSELQNHLTSQVTAIQKTIFSQEEAFQKAKEILIQEERVLKEHHKELNQCMTCMQVVGAEMKQQQVRLTEIKRREKELHNQLQDARREGSELLKAIEQDHQHLQIAIQKKEELYKLSQEQKEKLCQYEEKLQHAMGLLKSNQQKHLSYLQEESLLNAKLHEKKVRYENHLSRFNALKEIQEHAQNEIIKQEKWIIEGREKIEKIVEQIDRLKLDDEEVERIFQGLKKSESQGNKERERYLKEMTELESQWRTLKRLNEDMEGFSVSTKKLLTESKNKKSPLYQKIEPLFEYLIPKTGCEKTLALAMKAYAETLVIHSEEDFAILMEYAQSKKISDFSVIITSSLPSPSSQQSSNKVLYSNPNPIAYHFTQQLQCVENDHFFDCLGVYFHVGESKKIDNVFLRQAELQTIDSMLEAKKKEFQQFSLNIQQIADSLKLAEARRSECFENQKKREMDLVKENFHLQRLLEEQERLRKEIVKMDAEKKALEIHLNKADEIVALENKQQTLCHDAQAILESIKDQEENVEKETKANLKERQKGHHLEQLYQEAQLRWQKCEQEMKIRQTQLQHTQMDEIKVAKELGELKQAIDWLIESIVGQEHESSRLKQKLATLKDLVEEQEHHVNESQKRREGLEKDLVQQRRALSTPDKEKHALEITLTKILSEKQGVESELHNRFALDLSKPIPADWLLDLSIEAAVHEIHQIQAALESTGAVNMNAIEEFQATQDRFDYLDKQLHDLQESKKDLLDMIQKLDQESRKIFKKTFNQIRENFQKNFSTLFNGGSAEITFTSSSDILEAGVEIVVKPPGKQLKALSLLSGGEKCLTALALLFSIFEVRPAPFCILDEVDAPLDDTNVDRFTQMLKQFIHRTQFIIVTHNKKTMAMADLLIGVSMEEKGISKLISLTFAKSLNKEPSHANWNS